ncbi:MAG: lysylphosphatidylglycerol synthase transmembrane domain-containing protein [Candidatus Omnitrophota bacterium]
MKIQNGKTRIIIGFALSLLLLGIILYRLEWKEFFGALEKIQWRWIFPAVAVCITAGFLRALRWALLSEWSSQPWLHYWRALQIGYLFNNIFPARAGEMARIVVISRQRAIPFLKTAAASVIDRLMDMSALALIALWLLTYSLPQNPLYASFRKGIFIGIAALILMAVFLLSGSKIKTMIGWLENRLGDKSKRFTDWGEQIIDGLENVRNPFRFLLVFAIAATCFAFDLSGIYLMLWTMGWNLPFIAAVTTGVFMALGASLPSSPGYIGVYQAACILALGLFDIAESEAVAFSLIWQSLSLLLAISLGGGSAMYYGLNISRTAEEAAQTPSW